MKIADVTLEKVKWSKFGCVNCLYQSCECSPAGVNFEPDIFVSSMSRSKPEPTCKNYVYFD